MSRCTLYLFLLGGVFTGVVFYWCNLRIVVDEEDKEPYAPFMNETRAEKEILKKLLSPSYRFVSKVFFQGRETKDYTVGFLLSPNSPKRSFASKLYFHIDKLCSESTGMCFNIIDRYEMIDGRLFAYRGLRCQGSGAVLLLSEARLIPPKPIKWHNFNSKQWNLHKKSVRLVYARMMIAGSFFSGALDYDSTDIQNVLIIGLGGGVINNYFSTMDRVKLNVTVVDVDPVMKRIAQKWYQFKPGPMQRIIVDDGLRYIRNANKNGEVYDVILVDVCYNDHVPLMAPVEDFLVAAEIIEIYKLLKNDGAVVVNIVTKRENFDQADRVHFAYSRHFPSCYFMKFKKYDKMLFCSKKEKNSYLDNRDEIRNSFVRIDKELNFHLIEEMGLEDKEPLSESSTNDNN